MWDSLQRNWGNLTKKPPLRNTYVQPGHRNNGGYCISIVPLPFSPLSSHLEKHSSLTHLSLKQLSMNREQQLQGRGQNSRKRALIINVHMPDHRREENKAQGKWGCTTRHDVIEGKRTSSGKRGCAAQINAARIEQRRSLGNTILLLLDYLLRFCARALHLQICFYVFAFAEMLDPHFLFLFRNADFAMPAHNLLSGSDLVQERLIVDGGEKPQIHTWANSDNNDPTLFQQ